MTEFVSSKDSGLKYEHETITRNGSGGICL